MYCENCGGLLTANTYHCGKCGSEISVKKREALAKKTDEDERLKALSYVKAVEGIEDKGDAEKFDQESNGEEKEISEEGLIYADGSASKTDTRPQDVKKIKGEKFVKLVAIIMIIFGSLAILSSLGEFMSSSKISYSDEYGVPYWFDMFSDILTLALSSTMLAFGIYGIQNFYKPKKGHKIIKFSIIMLGLAFLPTIVGVFLGSSMLIVAGILSLAFNGALPILFLIGGIKLKSNLKTNAQSNVD